MTTEFQTYAGGISPPKTRKPTKPTRRVIDKFLRDNADVLQNDIKKISGKTSLPVAVVTRAECWQQVYVALYEQHEEFLASKDRLVFAKSVTKTVAEGADFCRPPREYSNASETKLHGDISVTVQSGRGVLPDEGLRPRDLAENAILRTGTRCMCLKHPTAPDGRPTQPVTEILLVQKKSRIEGPLHLYTVLLACGCVREGIYLEIKRRSRRARPEGTKVAKGTLLTRRSSDNDRPLVKWSELEDEEKARVGFAEPVEREDKIDDKDAGESDDGKGGRSSTVKRRPDWKRLHSAENRVVDLIDLKRRGETPPEESPMLSHHGTRHIEPSGETEYERAARILGYDIDFYWRYKMERESMKQRNRPARTPREHARFYECKQRLLSES